MDGQQMMQQKSLQRELYKWIILSSLILVVIAAVIAGYSAFQQAKELQDNTLKEISILVRKGQLNFSELPQRDNKRGGKRQRNFDADHDDNDNEIDDHDDNDKQGVRFTNKDRDDEEESTVIVHELGKSISLPGIPNSIPDGLRTIKLKKDEWRILAITQFDTERRFIIAQPTELRNNIAWSSSKNSFIPIILLVLILLLAIHIIMRRQFKSLNLLAKSIDKQDGTALQKLSDNNIPLEITPFVNSINALMTRVQQVMQKQQRFIADAAHELRTPITALSLQAENLKQAKNTDDRNERQNQLQKGFTRLGNLVAQLLDLARLQNNQGSSTNPNNPNNPKNKGNETQTVSINKVVQHAIEDLYPLAEAKNIDIGMLRQENNILVKDQNGRLSQLIQNAIGNAIHYTPIDGQVDISLFIESSKAVLLVEDNGIGIPEDQLEQVMQPFYRVLEGEHQGNGLGLAISQEIAEKLEGKISLTNRENGGLCFRYEQAIVEN